MNKSIKSNLTYFIVGIGIVAVIGGLLLSVSLDMRWMATEAMLLSSLMSFWISKKKGRVITVLNSLILTFPFALFFWLVIYKDLPSLWFIVLLFLGASYSGSLLKFKKYGLTKVLTTAVFFVIICVLIIPQFVGNDLTKFVRQEVEPFELIDHEGNKISSNELSGKTIVLDFYGTWCRPCIAELPELAKVRDYYVDNENIVFIIVNADQGGKSVV